MGQDGIFHAQLDNDDKNWNCTYQFSMDQPKYHGVMTTIGLNTDEEVDMTLRVGEKQGLIHGIGKDSYGVYTVTGKKQKEKFNFEKTYVDGTLTKSFNGIAWECGDQNELSGNWSDAYSSGQWKLSGFNVKPSKMQ